MNITVSGRQIKLTEEMRRYVDIKLSRLEKYLDPASLVKVTFREHKELQKVEITIMPVNGPIVRVEQAQDDVYSAIDIVYERLYKLLKKYKNRSEDKIQCDKSIRLEEEYILSDKADCIEEEDTVIIERKKRFSIKPMSPHEAILQMELIGHKFFMFRNQYTYEINIAYKREDGGYGIIEHE